MVQARIECGMRLRRLPRIAQSDGEVTQPALISDAANRTSGQPGFEFLFAPREKLNQRSRVEAMTHRKIRIARLRRIIPRATQLAVVAAIDAITDQRSQGDWNRAFQLNGQVGDA